MDSIVRPTINCGACGESVGYYDEKCSACGSHLIPLATLMYTLPSAKNHENAQADSELIKPFLDQLEDFHDFRVTDVDELLEVIKIIRDHNYVYRLYIIDILSLAKHFRGVCRNKDQETRDTYLELYKRIDAVYNSLTS